MSTKKIVLIIAGIVAVLALIVVLFVGGIAWFAFHTIANSEAAETARTFLRSNEILKQDIGEVKDFGWFVTGNINVLPPALHDPEDGPQARVGTCGFERTGMQVSIQGDDGRELKPFETGEICVIGPAVFAGYYDNPEANAKAFRDGWFRTGDLGHMDEQGFVYITGRASDMYISGGSNIYPREVEEKILTHPGIGEVAVLGVPDPVWGEVGVAVCVPRDGAGEVSELELATFLAAKVPRYKMPKRFFFWDALPKSGYGKMPKRMVRDELEARGLLDLNPAKAG